MTTINFSDFSREQAEVFFELQQVFKANDFLQIWIAKAKAMVINDLEATILKMLGDKLVIYHQTWNEQELQTKFISPLLMLVDFDDYSLEFAAFAERGLTTVIKDTQINGKVDWMVASGRYEPKRPFFFVHEYKKGMASTDPVGQLLATLCVARDLNSKPTPPNLFNPKPKSYGHYPLYSCYVVGAIWYFMRLKGQQYFISKAYDATNETDLHTIFQLLKAQRAMIIDLVKDAQA